MPLWQLPLRVACGLLATLAAGCVLITEIDYDRIPKDAGTGGSAGAPAGCTDDAMCNDGVACTVDHCVEGKCVFAPADPGTPCGDGDACNGIEACDGMGACQVKPVVIDDGDPCTTDTCDPKTGDVQHAPTGGGCVPWIALPGEGAPAPRHAHTAVWTGSRMIVWGGDIGGMTPATATGASFDPKTRTWTPTSLTGAPAPRHSHRAVWTGAKMIVWGGYGANSYVGAGGIYDPSTDTWKSMSTQGEPAPRVGHTMVWTGTKLVVWGGFDGNAALAQGGIYDPVTDTWKSMPAQGQPSPRTGHAAIWTGSRMVVWGGMNLFDWLGDGAMFDPVAGAWKGPTAAAGAPSFREAHTAVWAGKEMLIWGGFNGGPLLGTGGRFDPAAGAQGTWNALPDTGAPSARRDHVAVWTGKAMLIWGGCGEDNCQKMLDDGAVWAPGAGGGSWTVVPPAPTLTARREATAVWTGTEAIVWGGRSGGTLLGDGAATALP
jgi:hypothetical protein